LRGDDDPWASAAKLLSVDHLRGVLAAATLDQLRRAASAVFTVAAWQRMVALLGVSDIADRRVDLDGTFGRIDTAMVRRLQADRM
jgi:hypothetical protein